MTTKFLSVPEGLLRETREKLEEYRTTLESDYNEYKGDPEYDGLSLLISKIDSLLPKPLYTDSQLLDFMVSRLGTQSKIDLNEVICELRGRLQQRDQVNDFTKRISKDLE